MVAQYPNRAVFVDPDFGGFGGTAIAAKITQFYDFAANMTNNNRTFLLISGGQSHVSSEKTHR